MVPRQARANVALFRNDFRNFQILKSVMENGSPSAVVKVVNADAAEMMGAEFEVTAMPTERLTLNSGVSLLHSEYLKFEDIDDRTPGGAFQNLAGRQLSNAPNYTISLGAEYAWPIPGRWHGSGYYSLNTVRLRGEFYHTDYIVFRPFDHEDDRQSNYSLVNLFAMVASRDQGFEWRVFVKNLTDTRYFGFIAPGAAFSLAIAGGPPRTFGTELTIRF